MIQTFTTRHARLADLPEIRRLLVETWHATYDTIYGATRVTELTDDWHSLANLAVHVNRTGSAFLVLMAGEELLGTSLARDRGAGEVMLDRLYLRQTALGRGLGKRLLHDTLAQFPDASLCRLEVEPQNVAALLFYEKQGFTIASQTGHCGGGTSGIIAHIMQKKLTVS